MSRQALLALQQALVEDLTAAHHLGGTARGPETRLAGYDAERVALLARLTQSKRLGKIARVLPATFALLGPAVPALFPDFVEAHALRSANGYWNAVQFYRFLRRRQRRGLLAPAPAADLAACELAMASAARNSRSVARWPARGGVAIRRAAGSVLRTCAYDVRALLGAWQVAPPAAPVRRVHVGVAADAETGKAVVLELEPAAFALVRRLRQWQAVERAVVDDTASGALLRRLVAVGLLDVR